MKLYPWLSECINPPRSIARNWKFRGIFKKFVFKIFGQVDFCGFFLNPKKIEDNCPTIHYSSYAPEYIYVWWTAECMLFPYFKISLCLIGFQWAIIPFDTIRFLSKFKYIFWYFFKFRNLNKKLSSKIIHKEFSS